ncbi:MAG: hypothetical protein HWN66_14330 [Candidatus Helarchaeota archaeon]|nr:hypothetical protein [Candidatus Helarchaeota archaeon]
MSTKEIKMSPEKRERILRNLWILHDGRWFLKTVKEIGFDSAQKINMAVAKSFGRTEIKQIITETNYQEIKNIEEFKTLVETAGDLYFPEEHIYEIKILDKNSLLGHVLECYVYKNVSKAGITAIYQCAAKHRFESWLEACGLEGEIITEKNAQNCNGTCKIIFKVKW